MKSSLVVGFCALMISMQAVATTYSADFFEQGKTDGKKLFTSKTVVESKDGLDQVTVTFTDPDGQVAVEEKYWLNGQKINRAEIQQKQLHVDATVEVKDGQIFFTRTESGKTKKSDEKLEKTFVMPGNFQRFIKENWEALNSGKTVDFRFGVWDRRETVGFSLTKIGEAEVRGQKAVTLKMKPSSFLIAALVKPLEFKFAADGSKLLQSSGRIAPKQKSGDSWKDLDAEGVYSYE